MARVIFKALLLALSVQMSVQAGLRDLKEYCPPNEMDSPQNCRCPDGLGINYIYSYHNNGAEDRAWTMDCRMDYNFGVAYQYETPETDWDAEFRFDFGNSDQVGLLSGMSSYHDNHAEDRKFKFFVTVPSNLAIVGLCRWQVANEYDQELRIGLAGDEIIGGVHSIHNNGAEDRIWTYKICKFSVN